MQLRYVVILYSVFNKDEEDELEGYITGYGKSLHGKSKSQGSIAFRFAEG